ncbi:MAG: thymidine phosphorylase family protein [Alphaproteobacteria bacterium]|nr:thymidine phosphorylase family protein [Alphaproteobacteria bacterium]
MPQTFLAPMTLKVRRLGIDTRKHLVIYMRDDCAICRSEGFRSEARIKVTFGKRWIIATLNVITSEILRKEEIGLSESTWEKLGSKEGDEVIVSHADPLDSFGYVRAKLYGKTLTTSDFKNIMRDMTEGRYSDIQLSSFITACIDLSEKETISLTKTMAETGRQLKWDHNHIVDKHCVGGLPGNRTSMLVVPILAAHGLTIPKTSSRAITSPSGTADTMEVLAPVNLSVEAMEKVVEKEGGCIVWGGSVDLSPVDDVLVQVERALDLDSSSQLVASVLSKKVAAGSTDVLIDMPIGPTAKVRSKKEAHFLKSLFLSVGKAMGLNIHIVMTDGLQPVGRGIGPVLEARDVLSVLRGERKSPQDLRERSLFLAAKIMEFCCGHSPEEAALEAQKILDDGRALKKFEAICEAQGGMRELHFAPLTSVITAKRDGIVTNIDNRLIARIAKLAGAPDSPAAGIDLHTPLGMHVEKGHPLFTVHATTKGELDQALYYYKVHQEVIEIGEQSP